MMCLETKLFTLMKCVVSFVGAGKELCFPNPLPIQTARLNKPNEDWEVSIRDVQGIWISSVNVNLSEKFASQIPIWLSINWKSIFFQTDNYTHSAWSLKRPVLSSILNLGFKWDKIHK